MISRNRIPKRRLPVQANEVERVVEQAEGANAREKTKEAVLDFGARSKILLHFMKGRISLTPMETIMKIPGKLEYLEGLVKLAGRGKMKRLVGLRLLLSTTSLLSQGFLLTKTT